MVKKILLFLLLVIAVLAIVIATRPSHFRITRSIKVSAAPSAPFAFVNDFQKWGAWSPWEKMDPAMKRTFEGPAAGTGAIYRWESAKSEAGQGSMTITDSRAAEKVNLDLTFVKPMAGSSKVEFTFQPQGEQTLVTWTMEGENGYLAKVICLFMDMEKVVGEQFENGLAQLKAAAEGSPKP